MIILDGVCTGLRNRDMEAAKMAQSHKNDCPPGNEYYCLNGGSCFTVSVGGGHDLKGCQ